MGRYAQCTFPRVGGWLSVFEYGLLKRPGRVLDRGRVGLSVPVVDSQAMADAIRLVLDHPTPREILLAQAAEYALQSIANNTSEYCSQNAAA